MRLTVRGAVRYAMLTGIYGVIAFALVVVAKIFTCGAFLEGADGCDRPSIHSIELALLAGYVVLMIASVRADLKRGR